MTDCVISIITVTHNAAHVLAGCLRSVAAQENVKIEHLIVDANSNDGTVDLLRQWTDHPVTWISEPDRGISHAFNKGIARARGALIAILNADDRLTPGALERAVAKLAEHPNAGFAFGHCLHLETDGRKWLNLGNPRYYEAMRYFMPDVNHPTMIVRRSTYELIGVYTEEWRLAMDYDWLVRAESAGVRGILVDAIQAEMAMGGASDCAWWLAYSEARRIAIRHGASPTMAWIDHFGRLFKGGIRRLLVYVGATHLEISIRKYRQRRILRL